jgi:hypothetical protein
MRISSDFSLDKVTAGHIGLGHILDREHYERLAFVVGLALASNCDAWLGVSYGV